MLGVRDGGAEKPIATVAKEDAAVATSATPASLIFSLAAWCSCKEEWRPVSSEQQRSNASSVGGPQNRVIAKAGGVKNLIFCEYNARPPNLPGAV